MAKHASWTSLLLANPVPALLAAEDPSARLLALSALQEVPAKEADVRAARQAVVADRRIPALVDRLPDWKSAITFGGHSSPSFPPNLLRLLFGLGVRAGDYPAVERLLDEMLVHQSADGRFLTPGRSRGRDDRITWSSLPCDHFAILEVLLLFGRQDACEVTKGLRRVAETYTETAQGPGWHCLPDPIVKWRGPGRKDDVCLQVTVEALRLFAHVPAAGRPKHLDNAARTLLRAWRNRAQSKPYMFGHGRRFVTGKYPPTWYDASAVLEALAPYPSVWKGRTSTEEDRKSVREILSAFASTFDAQGLITPSSCYQGFADYSFGQKKHWSPWATARGCVLLRSFSSLVCQSST